MIWAFLIIALLGWGMALIHSLTHKHSSETRRILFMPTYAFLYAREYGLWVAVALQLLGLTGLVIGFTGRSF